MRRDQEAEVTWECAECHATEDRVTQIDGVCHHCGKLLCHDDQEIIPDVAFSAASGEVGAEAVHCRSCKRRHHTPIDVSLGTWA
jgi:hypothetical protein